MKRYPKELLPQPECKKIESGSILKNGFIRETKQDVYELLSQGYEADDMAEIIIGAGTSKKDVFELSLFLYGIFNETHIGIRARSKYANADWDFNEAAPENIDFEICKMYPLFLKAADFYERPVDFTDIDKNMIKCVLSYEHRPSVINYWHFQLFAEENNKRLTRDLGQKRYSRLAKHILETLVAKAICGKREIVAYTF